MRLRVESKEEFFRLQKLGRMGNHFRSWDSVDEVLSSGHKGGVYVRGPRRQWPGMLPWVPVAELRDRMREHTAKFDLTGVSYVEVLPFGTLRTINAELQLATAPPGDWTLYWGDSSTLSVRHDLEQNGRHDFGLSALAIVRSRVPEEDAEMLFELLENYPGAVVEFTTYGQSCGVLGRRTIVWEIRHY